MAALVGVIAHRCWDQIIGNLRASAGDESPAREYPDADISTRPSRPAGLMLSDAILQTSEGSECRRHSSPARANLWAALVVVSRPATGTRSCGARVSQIERHTKLMSGRASSR